MTKILGLHVSHDASACLLVDGELVFAVQEERLTRKKFYDGFPRESVKWILEQSSVAPRDLEIAIAGVAQHIENPVWVYLDDAIEQRPLTQWIGRIAGKIESMSQADIAKHLYFSKDAYSRYIRAELGELGLAGRPVHFFDHHECHAATAYLPTPYDEALVLTQDGRGDCLSGTVSLGRGGHLKRIIAQPSAASVAQLYAGVTKFLGFRALRHEGKITGLAAFGRDTPLREKIEGLFDIAEDGRISRVSCETLLGQIGFVKLTTREQKLINAGPIEYRESDRFGIIFQHWLAKFAAGISKEDIAYAIQAACENIVLNSTVALVRSAGHKAPLHIGLAGGLFANVKINQRIRDQVPGVGDVFVQPAMSDCGLSVGAALLLHQSRGGMRGGPLRHVYLGNDYSDASIENILRRWPSAISFEKVASVEQTVARLVAERRVVGRFNGAMEFGPRALGNRSIVLHPGDASMNQVMNQRLNRTEFMPFAPSVLDRRAADYFAGYQDHHTTADWMTITYNVHATKQKEIEATVHVDGTARPQVVRRATNPSYYKILSEFEKLTGIGCMVNTSFNMHEEPIVASPEDALRAFDQGSVDVLAIGSFVVKPQGSTA